MYVRAALLSATLTLVLAGCASSSADAPATSAASVASEEMTPSSTLTAPAETSAATESVQPSSEAASSGPGSYITLADYDADKAAYASTDVVLFFNAQWCSTCKVARDNIEADLAASHGASI